MNSPVIPGPLVLNIESLRKEAEIAARRKFKDGPRLKASDVHVTGENQVLVRLCSKSGQSRLATLLAPDGDLAKIGILQFQFSDLTDA